MPGCRAGCGLGQGKDMGRVGFLEGGVLTRTPGAGRSGADCEEGAALQAALAPEARP